MNLEQVISTLNANQKKYSDNLTSDATDYKNKDYFLDTWKTIF